MLNKILKLKIIAILEIVFGVVGLICVVIVVVLGVPLFKIVLSFLLFTLSLYAGLMIIKKERKGIVLSLIVQSLQIPYIIVGGFIYVFQSGPYTNFLFGAENSSKYMTFDFGIKSYFNFGWVDSIISYVFGINLIALIIFVFLFYQLKPEKSTTNNIELSAEQNQSIIDE